RDRSAAHSQRDCGPHRRYRRPGMMAAPERTIRNDLVRYSRLVYDKGWVANHDGNLTGRAERDRIVATPTSFSKGDVDLDSLPVVGTEGTQVAGHTRSFSEIALHLAVYAARDDARAVIHAHPPYATAMACAGVGLNRPFIAEAVVSLGPQVPLVPFAAPRTPAFTASLEPFLPYYDAVLLENHGVLASGDDLEQAFLRLELVEHLARIATHARSWGGVRPLPDTALGPLLAARKKAGLGPEARGLETPATPAAADEADLVDVVTQEVLALLKR